MKAGGIFGWTFLAFERNYNSMIPGAENNK